MEKGRRRYELREIRDADYNSYANATEWYFDNGKSSPTSPGGHSDKRRFPTGTIVLCQFIEGAEGGKKGYFMEGFARVEEFSEDGHPIEFGDSLSNSAVGRWMPPPPGEVILDTRAVRSN